VSGVVIVRATAILWN